MKNHLTTILFLCLVNFALGQNLKPSQLVHLQSTSVDIERKSQSLIYKVPKDSALIITTASLWCSNPNINANLYKNGILETASFNSTTGIVFRSESELTIFNNGKVAALFGYNIIGYLVKDE